MRFVFLLLYGSDAIFDSTAYDSKLLFFFSRWNWYEEKLLSHPMECQSGGWLNKKEKKKKQAFFLAIFTRFCRIIQSISYSTLSFVLPICRISARWIRRWLNWIYFHSVWMPLAIIHDFKQDKHKHMHTNTGTTGEWWAVYALSADVTSFGANVSIVGLLIEIKWYNW